MSERGVFAVDRGIFTDPDFAKEPFSEREAFMWLISEAAWKPHGKRADGKMVALKRGQLCHAVRFMAEAWQWSKSRVDRFLDRLENRDMIKRDRGTRTPVLTICKYDSFQRVSLPDRDNSGTTTGTTAGQERDKLEDRKNKESSSLRSEESAAKPGKPSDLEAFKAQISTVLDPQRVDAICKLRRKKGAVFSEHAGKLLVSALSACPDPRIAADEMVLRNWTSVKPEWLGTRGSSRPQGPPSTGSGNAMVDRLDQLMAGMEQKNAHGPTIETSDFHRDVDRSPQAVLGFASSGRIIEGR